MKRLTLGLGVVLAACGPGEATEETSTVTIPPTSTTQQVTTTTAVPTTTTVPRSTTTTHTTTTTSEGNWADGPLITTDFGALGWWDGTRWLAAETVGALPVAGGEDYQTIVGDSVGLTTGGPQRTVCETLGLVGVDLSDSGLLGGWPGPFGVAISAPWDLQPYLYEEITDDGTYAGFAASLLRGRGLEVDQPGIKQVIRTDLEGDGVNEVLVVAEDVFPSYIMEPGDYSILFLRKVIEEEVQTAILGDTVVLDETDQYSGSYSVGTVADLNGTRRWRSLPERHTSKDPM